MSRLIIKNLPSSIKEDRLRKHFANVGQVTDCSLRYTKGGQFRKFAFLGYKTENDAQAAIKQFNQTFIDASKIQVEICRDFGDTNKPRAWSKYSKESSISQNADGGKARLENEKKENEKRKKENKQKKEAVVNELLGELKDDPNFNEFLEVHQNVGMKQIWTNDSEAPVTSKGDNKTSKLLFDDDSDSDSGNDSHDSDEVVVKQKKEKEVSPSEDNNKKIAKTKGLSDLDYLKSKVDGQAVLSDDDSSDSSSDEDGDKGDNKDKNKGDNKDKNKGANKEKGKMAAKKKDIVKETDQATDFMLKLKGLPCNVGENSVKEFFEPLEIVRLKIPRNAKKKPLGIAYVGFKTDKDLEKALGRNKNFIGGKRIYLKVCGSEPVEAVTEDKPRPWEIKQQQETANVTEGIAETGRLFVRNLSYMCTEEDMEAEFKKYGPLTEVNLPIDSLTKKIKGFAFITFMLPEHAVKAYSELDGKVFQGRMLHILPGKEKVEKEENSAEGSSFKKQKQAKQRKTAGSSHNWNSLFLGANVVADVLAEKYKTSKSDILDNDLKGSLGVRMALGETQIVSETRDFLIDNGISLDSFSQANAERSKTVILVKNLPANTAVSDIENVFSPHGTLGRVLLPPSGVTAIVEFVAPTEARAAFTKLAYTKFQYVPLYLEWAPMKVFNTPPPEDDAGTHQKTEVAMETDTTPELVKEPSKTQVEKRDTKDDEEDDDEDDDTPGSVLFVKNLNFDTEDDALHKHFKKCGKIKSATVAKKKDLKYAGNMLSMGYGFVEFKEPDGAKKAIKEMQHSDLDNHSLELKISNRTTASSKTKTVGHKKQTEKKQKTTKILVRNIPFEAKTREIEELFKVFGELKTVRLPKKMSGTGPHRGFGFVDFLTRQDAKRAFESLCHSTHLYGRRLVLEWADAAEDIDDIRKRTAQHYHDDGVNKKFTKSNLQESLEMS